MVNVLNTLGVGSGVDTTAVINALVAAEKAPRETALTTRSTRNDARISGVAQVNAGLSGLIAALAARTAGGALGPLPSSGDTTIIAASATSGATPLLNPVDIEIKALAGGQTLVSGALASAASPVGVGTLTMTLGTATSDGAGGFGFAGGSQVPISVMIDLAHNSLSGLRDAINAKQTGNAAQVVASIIADGSGARLVLKGPAGAASGFILAADPVSGDDGLTRFTHTPAIHPMAVAASARDASLVIDGVAVTRQGNYFVDLIDGVTLDLRRAVPGTTVTIAATRDADGLKSAVRDLVGALNAVNAITAGLIKGGTTTGSAGILVGDATLRQLRGQLTGLTAAAAIAVTTGIPTRLADLGVITARDGTLSIDEKRLGTATAANPDAVEKLLVALTAGGATKGPLAAIAASFASAISTARPSNRFARETTAIASEKAALDGRMTTYRATLIKQFTAMEVAVAAAKSTQSFLDTQIKAWNRTN